jgi:hypothetical protein
MFLLDPAVWGNLGDRRVWVSIGVGFDGGRHFRRRARIEEPPPYGQPDIEKLNLRWTDSKGKLKRDLVPIVHLSPTPPARGKEGVVLKGPQKGRLVIVTKFLQSKKTLYVSRGVRDQEWEESQEDVCWVERSNES